MAVAHAAAQGAPLVSAWATAHRLVLGQLKVEAKANDIIAIPTLGDR